MPYETARQRQMTLVELQLAAIDRNEPCIDSVIILEHTPVFTLGAGGSDSNLRFNPVNPPPGFELYRAERGGEATYHGPGQIVLYPILNLRYAQTDS